MSRALLSLLAVLASAIAIAGCKANNVGTTACTPGATVFVACGCDGVGSCTMEPDPVLRVCDGEGGATACTWDTQLAESDDGPSCGRCPGVTVTCPASGTLYVEPRGLYPDEIVDCQWATREE